MYDSHDALLSLASASGLVYLLMSFFVDDPHAQISAEVNVLSDGRVHLTEHAGASKRVDLTGHVRGVDVFLWLREHYPFAQIAVLVKGVTCVLRRASTALERHRHLRRELYVSYDCETSLLASDLGALELT